MPIQLEALCARIAPARTTLLLGAGASVPSGAPTGSQLAAKLWKKVAQTEPQSSDLPETASILERRHSRRAVVDAIVSILKPLQPTGGLLGLPLLGWRNLFSTNFDCLVEAAYKKANVPLIRIRSNYDLSYQESRQDTTLYKMHGCISQDRSLGDKASMILSEHDYEEFSKYRQSMFSLLETALLTGDVLIVGQSLTDRHLSDLIKRVLKYKSEEGAPGEVFVLIYDQDNLRAPLLEDRGARIAFGGIDAFVHAMAGNAPSATPEALESAPTLPVALVSVVDNVEHLKTRDTNVVRMFNGSPASYPDIHAGNVFRRASLELQLEQLVDGGLSLLAVVGAAGVGKTTFARQVLYGLHQKGYLAAEHRNDFPFYSKNWIAFEAELRANGKRAVLLLDECTRYMRQVNLLVDHLATVEGVALAVIATANAAQWTPRLKSPIFFRGGRVLELSRLEDADINALINLVDYNDSVSTLVHSEFKQLTREKQFARLRERCGADMFVCLKNIFANDSLDNILLAEYGELDEAAQEYYRYIAALESVGMRVHRQLVMRMLGLRADAVGAILSNLTGIVDEFEINAKEGVYGWATRHLVIARKITEYKFSSLDELRALFERIIDNINPAVPTELQSIRDLCDADFGIGRLGESVVRRSLYRKLIEAAPAERIPWHRLIREFLIEGDFEQASFAIRDAEEAVGADGPIDRYSVRLLVARAERTPKISESDRLALLRQAYELASKNIERHRVDKHSYRVLCDVAVALAQRGESRYFLEEATGKMRDASDQILDPDLDRELRHFEGILARL